MTLGSRVLRLSLAAGATLAGGLIQLLRSDHFRFDLFSHQVALAVVVLPMFALLSWLAALLALIFVLLMSFVFLALPFRVTRTEIGLWVFYALLLGPAAGIGWKAYANARPVPRDATTVCVPRPKHLTPDGENCTRRPNPRDTPGPSRLDATSYGASREETSMPMLSHPTPIP